MNSPTPILLIVAAQMAFVGLAVFLVHRWIKAQKNPLAAKLKFNRVAFYLALVGLACLICSSLIGFFSRGHVSIAGYPILILLFVIIRINKQSLLRQLEKEQS